MFVHLLRHALWQFEACVRVKRAHICLHKPSSVKHCAILLQNSHFLREAAPPRFEQQLRRSGTNVRHPLTQVYFFLREAAPPRFEQQLRSSGANVRHPLTQV